MAAARLEPFLWLDSVQHRPFRVDGATLHTVGLRLAALVAGAHVRHVGIGTTSRVGNPTI